MKRNRCCFWIGLAWSLLAGSLAGQETTGAVIGVVLRADGSPQAGARVEAASLKLPGGGTTVTDGQGRFRLQQLIPGSYRLTVSLPGSPLLVREGIRLHAGQTVSLPRLVLSAGAAAAISPDGATQSDARSAATATTLTKAEWDVLPKGRDPESLHALVPGVQIEPLLGGLSLEGASGSENRFFIDGQPGNSLFAGRYLQRAVLDFVDEVRLQAGGFASAHPGALGGVIHVVTRSGGGAFHGDAVGYFSGSALRGRERDTTILDPASAAPRALTYNYSQRGQSGRDIRLEAGAGIGGPLFRDRLWFHAALLPSWTRSTLPVIFLHPYDARHLASEPFAAPPRLNLYDYSRSDGELRLMLKLSARPRPGLNLSLSFLGSPGSASGELPDRDGRSADTIDYSALGYSRFQWALSGSADWSPHRRLLIGARAGFIAAGTRNGLSSPAGESQEPLYYFQAGNEDIAGFPAELRRPAGWMSRSPQSMTSGHYQDLETRLSLGADLAWFLDLAGEHAWKAGVEYTRASLDRNTLWSAPEVIFTDFSSPSGSVAVLVNGGPGSLPDSVNHSAGGQYGDYARGAGRRLALYLQDSWTIAGRLTLSAGVRLESESVPGFNDDPEWAAIMRKDCLDFSLLDKVAPRLGVAWNPGGDDGLKLYAAYGIFFGDVDLDLAMRAFGGTRWVQDSFWLPAAQAHRLFEIGRLKDGKRDYSFLNPRYPWDRRFQYWDVLDPELKPMAQRELCAGMEKKISRDLSLSLRATWRDLIRAIDDVGYYQPNIWEYYYFLANPGFGYSRPYTEGGKLPADTWPIPRAERDYKALTFSLEKRMSRNWMGGVHLTLSRLYGNYTGIVSADEAIAGNGTGIQSGYVSRYFDEWWMSYTQDGRKTLSNGLLPTDRPIVAKAYGSYAFPFGLTVGGVFNWLQGTPKSTEWYVNNADGFYPLGRGDLGRTPALWFLNLYAAYDLKLGRNTLQFSVNVDNATDNDTATWYWTRINVTSPDVWWDYLVNDTATVIQNGYDFRQWEGPYPQRQGTWVRDARFNLPMQYQAPIAVRLGVRFMF